MNAITLTRKIQLGIHVPASITDETEKETYKKFIWTLVRNINKQNFELHNLMVKKMIEIDSVLWGQLTTDSEFISIRNHYYLNVKHKESQKQYYDYIHKKRNVLIQDYGYKKLSSYMYHYLVQYLKSLPREQQIMSSYTYCAIAKNVVDKYYKDSVDVNQGKKSVAFYRNTQPIPINIKAQSQTDKNGVKTKNLGAFWFNKYDDRYTFRFRSVKKHTVELTLIFGRDRSNNKAMIDKLYNNDSSYKLCDSKIQVVDDKIYLLLTIKQFSGDKKLFDVNKIMGINLGVKCAAYVATNITNEHKQIGDRYFALMKVKQNIEKDRRMLQRNLFFAKSGHGRKRKLQKLQNLRNYEKNFRSTFNHKISSEIIRLALNWNCGQINAEDISRIPQKIKEKKVLRHWAYFDLLSKIEYKAKINGIKFVKIDPAYTSQTCNMCGKIGKHANADTFICCNPDCRIYNKKINADYNAALNIARIKKE